MKEVILIASLAAILSACGTTQVAVQIDDRYETDVNTRVEVGEVRNETEKNYDIDIATMLSVALKDQLRESQLLGSISESGNIIVVSEIIEYEKGNAFKRWLWPGYGSTKLAVNSEIKDSQGKTIGSMTSRHTVDAGGAYTIGAWEKIFEDVSRDIVKELSIKLKNNQKA